MDKISTKQYLDRTPKESELINLFNSPKIIGVVSDANYGKSNLLYNIIHTLSESHQFNLFTYGLKQDVGDKKIYSLEELESIKDSIIVIDEFYSLFDLEDRKKRKLIEATIRLIFHNNNVLILCGLPENFKKFISNKLNVTFYGRCTIGDFINGSKIKYNCLAYKGIELGSSILNLTPDRFLMFDGGYQLLDVPYIEEFDLKIKNSPILCPKESAKIVENSAIETFKK